MERKMKFHYQDSCDMLDTLEALGQTLPAFGVSLEVLDGGDGYEEVRITKLEDKQREIALSEIDRLVDILTKERNPDVIANCLAGIKDCTYFLRTGNKRAS